jgi:hypothetical protein
VSCALCRHLIDACYATSPPSNYNDHSLLKLHTASIAQSQIYIHNYRLLRYLIIMKLLSAGLALTLLPLALANSVLVTYPKDTPDSVIDEAKDSIRKAVRDILVAC